MATRLSFTRALVVGSVAATLPLSAHGEQLVVVFGSLLGVGPLVLILLLPWRTWWVRLAAVATFVAATALLWVVIFPGLEPEKMSSIVEWLLLLSPTIAAVTVGLVLRHLSKRSAV